MHGKRPTMSTLGGIVAAAHPHAAQAGARILTAGGNAFDAAAATAAALNVVEPFMSSLAGMGLATLWIEAEQRVRVLDFVPPIPAGFPVDRFSNREELARGAAAVGTPGNLAGWCEIVRAHGRLPLAEVLQPAIELAEGGFPLLEFGVEEINEQIPLLAAHAAFYGDWARTYLPGGGPVKLGDVLRQPDLAGTLREIAAHGPDHLYRGPLGATIVSHLQSLGGCLTREDLAATKPVWREPLAIEFRGHRIHVPPPPCEGFQFLLTLRILERLDCRRHPRDGIDHLDTVIRAIRLAAGERIARNNPDPATLADILSDANVARLAARAADGAPITGPTEQWMPSSVEDPGHTTSFSIVDRQGNAICITQSIGSPFGSGIVVPGTGLCLNNFLYWTDVQAKSPNRSKGGQALPMCMAPTLALRAGKPALVLGTPGSYGILQTQAQAYIQHLEFGLPIQDAIAAPRARLWDGRKVEIENRIAPEVIAGLCGRGHEAAACDVGWTMRVGGMQAVAIDQATGARSGACDPRRDGDIAFG